MALVDANIVGGVPAATLAQGLAYLRRINRARAAAKGVAPLTDAESAGIAGNYWLRGHERAIAPDGGLAQAITETDAWTFGNQVPASAHNPAGIGAINDGKSYLVFPDWATGIGVQFDHLLAWAGKPGGERSPRYTLVEAVVRGGRGYATTWRSLGGRWAVPGTTYADGIEKHWQAMIAEAGGTVTLTKPAVISNPSPNHGYPGDYKPEAVVWHITAGSGASALSWLTNPDSNASANYVITEDGKVHELVNPEAGQQGAAWANGDVQQPNLGNPLIAAWVTAGINPNRRCVSIEHAGQSSNGKGGSLTKPQIAATVRLTAWLCSRFGIAPDRAHILPHAWINSVTRPNCPGFSEVEWVTWVDAINEIVKSGTTPPPSADPGFPGALNVAGETVLNGVNFGGTAVTVEWVQVGVRNAMGERYSNKWENHHVDPVNGWKAI